MTQTVNQIGNRTPAVPSLAKSTFLSLNATRCLFLVVTGLIAFAAGAADDPRECRSGQSACSGLRPRLLLASLQSMSLARLIQPAVVPGRGLSPPLAHLAFTPFHLPTVELVGPMAEVTRFGRT